MESRLLILCLHRVGVPPANAKIRGLFISPRALKAQLLLVRAMGFRFMTLRDALRDRRGSRAVLTFDDGYADNYSHAFPVLSSLGIPATLFVITGDVGRTSVVWDEAGDDLPADMLTWDEIIEMRDTGWEIGSHGDNHIHLDRYTEAEQESVIKRSINMLRDQIGEAPTSFAYPYGVFNQTTKRVLDRLKIRHAVTIKPASANRGLNNDMLELGRVALGGRHFYHHIKNTARIGKAVGNSELLKAAGSYLFPDTLNVSTASSISLSLSQTNK